VVRRSGLLLGVAHGTAFVALGVATLPFLVLSTGCSSEEQAAYERWLCEPPGLRPSDPPARLPEVLTGAGAPEPVLQ
jgi:hypothetical protein